jgi:hypothetical protein
MSPKFPCDVERDLERYDAEMSERDRYEIALEQEAKAVYDGYVASPSPDRLLNAIDRAVSSDVADVSRLMSAISDGDVETIGKIVLRLYDHEAWIDAKYAAERKLKERE